MSKKTISVIVFLILLFLLGVVAIMTSKKPSTPQTANSVPTSSESQQTTQPQANNGTLKDLLTGGKAQKCTFTNNTDQTNVSTTIYVADGKMRGDIVSSSSEFTIKSHMIVDSSYSYIWTDNSNQGFKYPINNPTTVTPSQQNQSVDLNQKINYTCGDWSKDSSLFNLPANVTFQTLTVPTLGPTATGGVKGSSDTNTTQCAACDNLPAGQAQTACKTALNCK